LPSYWERKKERGKNSSRAINAPVGKHGNESDVWEKT